MTYAQEAAELDAEILACIHRRSVPDFDALALRVFAHQLRYNAPYARFCAAAGIALDTLPRAWDAIPAVPSAAFKEAQLCTFDPSRAALAFQTSGTTAANAGTHYMETSALYDAALLAGFEDAILAGVNSPLRYLLLVPNPAQRPQSSLGYMMRAVARAAGDGSEEWFLDGDILHDGRFAEACVAAFDARVPVCVAGTAFAFVQLLDALKERGVSHLPLAGGSRVMETGGFKGRSRMVGRAELYDALAGLFDLPLNAIVAEYGMTELTSQYYDRVPSSSGARVKQPPAWMRARVVGADGKPLPDGTVGALVHVDLANRSSCIAIQTEDLGVRNADGSIVLIGREHGAELRGCSLDAEQLRTAAVG